MELREFVKQSLVEIVQGVEEANIELSGNNELTANNSNRAFLLAYSGGDNPKGPHVEFDVAVSTKTDLTAGAGASVKLYVVDLDAGGSSSTVKEHISHVRFAVLVKEHQG